MYPYPTLAQFKRRDGNMTSAVEATQDKENTLKPDSSRPMYKPQLLCLGKLNPLLVIVCVLDIFQSSLPKCAS